MLAHHFVLGNCINEIFRSVRGDYYHGSWKAQNHRTTAIGHERAVGAQLFVAKIAGKRKKAAVAEGANAPVCSGGIEFD